MNAVLIFVLGSFVILGCISGAYIYPSIQWSPQNPLFIADGDTCGPGPRTLKVELQSTAIFICPNTATVLQKVSMGIQPANMYENLWLLYNKTAFDECDVSADPNRKRLLACNTPGLLNYISVQFALHTADPDGPTFKGGQSYYFIATSDGTKLNVNSTSGGHCEDSVNNIYMKIEVYVCDSADQDPECNNTNVGELKCPNVPGASPSSSIASPIETPITTSSTDEISTTGSIQSSTIFTASEASCIPTVTTKTISSEVTKSVSCADVCDKSLSSTVTSTETIVLTTKMSTKTVHSTVIPAKTGQAEESISTTTVTTTEITKTVVPTAAVPTETLMQLSGSLSTEATPASDLSSQTVSSAATSTNKRPSDAVTFIKTVSFTVLFTDLCDRCFSLSTQSTTSSVNANEDNGSQQPPKQDKLSNDKENSNKEEKWMTAAIVLLVLFCLSLIIIFRLVCRINYRKTFRPYSNRGAPEYNGTELNESSGTFGPNQIS